MKIGTLAFDVVLIDLVLIFVALLRCLLGCCFRTITL